MGFPPCIRSLTQLRGLAFHDIHLVYYCEYEDADVSGEDESADLTTFPDWLAELPLRHLSNDDYRMGNDHDARVIGQLSLESVFMNKTEDDLEYDFEPVEAAWAQMLHPGNCLCASLKDLNLWDYHSPQLPGYLSCLALQRLDLQVAMSCPCPNTWATCHWWC